MWEEILELYKEGKRLEDIKSKMNVKTIEEVKEFIHFRCTKLQLKKLREIRGTNINQEEIYKLRQDNKTYTEIAYLYDVTPRKVTNIIENYCKNNNLDFISRNKKTLDDDVVNKIIEEYKQGYTYKEIVERLGVPIQDVTKYISLNISEQEKKAIILKRKSELIQNSSKIISLYENGTTTAEIAKIFNCNVRRISGFLAREYGKTNRKIPTVLTKEQIRKHKDNNNISIEEFKKTIDGRNIVASEALLNEVYGIKINIEKIKKFVIDKIMTSYIDEQYQKSYFTNLSICRNLKEHGYSLKYQATALLYSLTKITNSTNAEIAEIVDNDTEILEAIDLINKEESDKEYFENLEKNPIAKNVKFAIVIENLKQANNAQRKINNINFTKYIKIMDNKEFLEEFNNVFTINQNYYYNMDDER